MAHLQKPDFVFRRNGRVHLNRPGGLQFSRLLAPEVCASAVVMLDTPCSEVVWRVLATHCIRQFPLPLPCVTVCHHISTGVLKLLICIVFDIPFSDLSQGVQTKSWKMLLLYFTFKTHSSSDSSAPEDLSCCTINKRNDIDESVKSVLSSIFHILLDSSLSVSRSVRRSFFSFSWIISTSSEGICVKISMATFMRMGREKSSLVKVRTDIWGTWYESRSTFTVISN